MTDTSSPALAPRPSWAAVVSLGFCIFTLVTAEFLPSSLLPRIAQDLGVSEGAAGQSVTTTAIAGLFVPIVFRRMGRRALMIGLTALAVVSSLVVAVAPNLALLLTARVLVGLAIGGFWALAIAACVQLVGFPRLGRAMTIINTGMALATIAAIPVGAWLSGLWGWRTVFLVAAVLALLAVVFQLAALPRIAPAPVGGLAALGATLRSGVLILGLLAILLAMGGQYTGYTYILPAAQDLASIGDAESAVLLLVYGIASVIGTAAAGFVVDRALRVAALVSPALIAAGMLILVLAGGSVAGLLVAVAVWGFGFGGLPTAVQTWTARAAPDRLEQIGGLTVVSLQVSIAVGAFAGGLLFDGIGASAPAIVGAIAVMAGALLLSGLRLPKGAPQG